MKFLAILSAAALLGAGALCADVPRPGSTFDTLAMMKFAAHDHPDVADTRIDPASRQLHITLKSGKRVTSSADHLHLSLRDAATDADREIILQTYTKMLDTLDTDAGLRAADLRPVIRHADSFDTLASERPVSLPFAGDLRRYFVLDSPDAMTFVTPDILAGLAMDLDSAAARAAQNFQPEHWEMQELGGGYIMLLFDGTYESSLILDPGVMQHISRMYPEIAAVALARDLVIFTDATRPGAVVELAKLAAARMDQLSHTLSPQVLLWTGGEWELY